MEKTYLAVNPAITDKKLKKYRFPNKRFIYRIQDFIFLLFLGMQGYAQQVPSSLPEQTNVNPVDLIGVIGEMFNKKGPERNDIIIPGVSNVSLLPIIGYGPANGFVFGTAISATNLLGSQKNTQLSSALVSISLTTKKQILLCARSDIYLPDNTWYIPGDVRLLFFAQPTYGLGIYGLNSTLNFNIDGTDLSNSVLEQPMRFNYIRVYMKPH